MWGQGNGGADVTDKRHVRQRTTNFDQTSLDDNHGYVHINFPILDEVGILARRSVSYMAPLLPWIDTSCFQTMMAVGSPLTW